MILVLIVDEMARSLLDLFRTSTKLDNKINIRLVDQDDNLLEFGECDIFIELTLREVKDERTRII